MVSNNSGTQRMAGKNRPGPKTISSQVVRGNIKSMSGIESSDCYSLPALPCDFEYRGLLWNTTVDPS